MLIRSALLALQHANETGNYTVLRDLGAPGFQTAYTAARLAEIFAGLRNGRVDLSAVAVLEPQITQGPQIEQGNLVRLAGYFATGGQQLNFELAFQSVDGRLKLFGMSANLAQPQGMAGRQGSGAAPGQPDRPAPGPSANPGSQPAQTNGPASNPKP